MPEIDEVATRCTARRDAFLRDLNADIDADRLVRRHLVLSDPAGLTRDEFIWAREWISARSSLHPNCVAVVGSCQTGFSLKKKSSGRYQLFGVDSDVDIALIDRPLYDRIWQGMLEAIDNRRQWLRQDDSAGFLRAKWQGWIDVKHVVRAFPGIAVAVDLKKLFDTATRDRVCGFRPVSCRLYPDWYFLESYQRIMVRDCVREVHAQKLAQLGAK